MGVTKHERGLDQLWIEGRGHKISEGSCHQESRRGVIHDRGRVLKDPIAPSSVSQPADTNGKGADQDYSIL